MENEFQVEGNNENALFTLKVHRGDGMALLAMNWKEAKPPVNFVGFAIEYKEPEGDRFYALKNRLCFLKSDGAVDPNKLSTLRSPIQKFRWVHFPRNAEMEGLFTYRVTPVFMNEKDEISYGDPQIAEIELRRETYPGQLNVCFTRGFVASQAFIDNYESAGPISTLLPNKADKGLIFKATHPKTKEALAWMGFEARNAILEVLDKAIADKKSSVKVIAYDLSEPEVVSRLEKLGKRVQVIIDDDKEHGKKESGESQAEKKLVKTAGRANVKRQHMGNLQHNKMIIVESKKDNYAVCGSTNFSWRGFYVQANNAIVLMGSKAIKPFLEAFDNFWQFDKVAEFGATTSTGWQPIGIDNIDAQVTFSPHLTENGVLESIADDLNANTTSSLLYSLAFLYQTKGAIRDSIEKISKSKKIFVYGMSDKKVGGLDLQKPDGNIAPVFPALLTKKNTPEPFKSEPSGGGGIRLHHKFLVIDFDKPSARVYMGSYNFSDPADLQNGENLLLIKDRRIAVSYMIEAIRLFDHYHFRVAQQDAKKAKKVLALARPPKKRGEKPWWSDDYTNSRRVKDRLLFS